MATDIKCSNCGHQFPMEEAVTEEYKKGLREQMQAFINNKEKEFIKKQEEFARRLEDEKRQVLAANEQSLRKTITGDFEHKLRLLEEINKDKEEKLKAGRQRELEFLKKEQ